MKLPKEEVFEVLFSEMEKMMEENHPDSKDSIVPSDDCEVCQVRQEFSKRSMELLEKSNKICIFDDWVGQQVSGSSLALACMMLPQAGLTLIDIARIAFYFGLRMGYAQKENEILNDSQLFEG